MVNLPRTRRPDDPLAVAGRLRLLRLAYGVLQGSPVSQSEFARRSGIGIAAWNNAETGDNRIGLDNALAVCRLTGATLDFIYQGNTNAMPFALMNGIRDISEAEEVPAARA